VPNNLHFLLSFTQIRPQTFKPYHRNYLYFMCFYSYAYQVAMARTTRLAFHEVRCFWTQRPKLSISSPNYIAEFSLYYYQIWGPAVSKAPPYYQLDTSPP